MMQSRLGAGLLLGGVLLGALSLSACGGGTGSSGSHIATPEERLAEEEKLAYEAEQREKKREAEQGVPVAEEPMAKPFDDKQAEMELQRATRSAESCTGVVADSKERGQATVNVTFKNDGSVSSVNISAPFDGTKLGDCVVNAYKAVIVPPFDGSDHPKVWELTLKDPPKGEGTAPKKK